jgi:hypothetical protein
MDTWGSLPISQKLAIEPYPWPQESSAHSDTSFKIHFNIILRLLLCFQMVSFIQVSSNTFRPDEPSSGSLQHREFFKTEGIR